MDITTTAESVFINESIKCDNVNLYSINKLDVVPQVYGDRYRTVFSYFWGHWLLW